VQREQFLEYVDHFNNKRYDLVTSYFTPDVTVEYSSYWGTPETPARTLHGRQEFINWYRGLHEYVREIMELGDFMVDGHLMFVELYTEFHCFEDTSASLGLSLKKGDVSIMTNWVLYNMEGDKMKRIRIAFYRTHDPKLAKF
jgi:hypothetical protein